VCTDWEHVVLVIVAKGREALVLEHVIYIMGISTFTFTP